MRQVVPPIPIVQKILGEQKTAGGASCRLSVHCMRVERPEGILLYHTLTGELLLLSAEEAAALRGLPGSLPPALGELAARWFLRPLEADDMALADQVRQIAGRFEGKKETALTNYTIFTTTDCNARCFYCFEAGWKRSSMSDQTARDTAKYIAAHCGGKPVNLRWFGGEPLVNIRAIDVITDSLRRQGVEFRSTMTSNGYLFNEMLVRRAKDAWNLTLVQITLDGTEDVYNQRKAYVNPQGSPYKQVLRNIDLLLAVDIRVKVRLNMDEDNAGDLYVLLDELTERFARKPGFDIRTAVICENVGSNSPCYTEEERRSYAEKCRSLRIYAEEKGIVSQEPLKRGIVINSCLADNDRHTAITPEGRLGLCDSCMNGAIWGSIYSDEVDEKVLQQWKERKEPEAVCESCAVYPQCLRLKKCPTWLEYCTPIERSSREDKLRRAIVCAYENWKAAGQN